MFDRCFADRQTRAYFWRVLHCFFGLSEPYSDSRVRDFTPSICKDPFRIASLSTCHLSRFLFFLAFDFVIFVCVLTHLLWHDTDIASWTLFSTGKPCRTLRFIWDMTMGVRSPRLKSTRYERRGQKSCDGKTKKIK